ncbi:MAG: hypothetical protein ACO3ND_05130 [Opitutales bacterium]
MDPLVIAAVLLPCAAAAAWLLIRGRAVRRAAPRPRRRAATAPSAPAGSDDMTRAAWTVGKLAGLPPRKVPSDRPVGALLGKAARRRLGPALEREFGVAPPDVEALLGLTPPQLGRLMRQLLRRGRAKPRGRRRPSSAGDVMADLPAPLVALASELGLRAEWDIARARDHLTREYLRQNARIHLAAKAEERDAVQARLEEIGRLRRALATGR